MPKKKNKKDSHQGGPGSSGGEAKRSSPDSASTGGIAEWRRRLATLGHLFFGAFLPALIFVYFIPKFSGANWYLQEHSKFFLAAVSLCSFTAFSRARSIARRLSDPEASAGGRNDRPIVHSPFLYACIALFLIVMLVVASDFCIHKTAINRSVFEGSAKSTKIERIDSDFRPSVGAASVDPDDLRVMVYLPITIQNCVSADFIESRGFDSDREYLLSLASSNPSDLGARLDLMVHEYALTSVVFALLHAAIAVAASVCYGLSFKLSEESSGVVADLINFFFKSS